MKIVITFTLLIIFTLATNCLTVFYILETNKTGFQGEDALKLFISYFKIVGTITFFMLPASVLTVVFSIEKFRELKGRKS